MNDVWPSDEGLEALLQGTDKMHCDLMTQDYQRYLAAKESIVDDEELFPRRRNVRAECEEVLHALLAHSDENGKFDRYFLTSVRDLMREGMSFVDAVGSFAPELVSEGGTVFHLLGAPQNEPFPFPSDEDYKY